MERDRNCFPTQSEGSVALTQLIHLESLGCSALLTLMHFVFLKIELFFDKLSFPTMQRTWASLLQEGGSLPVQICPSPNTRSEHQIQYKYQMLKMSGVDGYDSGTGIISVERSLLHTQTTYVQLNTCIHTPHICSHTHVHTLYKCSYTHVHIHHIHVATHMYTHHIHVATHMCTYITYTHTQIAFIQIHVHKNKITKIALFI